MLFLIITHRIKSLCTWKFGINKGFAIVRDHQLYIFIITRNLQDMSCTTENAAAAFFRKPFVVKNGGETLFLCK